MDDPRESAVNQNQSGIVGTASPQQIDDADAAIAWYLSDEFEEHLGRCFEEGKRKALDARDRFLKSREENSAHETKS